MQRRETLQFIFFSMSLFDAQQEKRMMEIYNCLYTKGASSRFRREGWIGLKYCLPKFVKYFRHIYHQERGLRVLELGGGEGMMRDLLLQECGSMIEKYVVSEHSVEAVESLKNRGVDAEQIDALNIPYPDSSFDLVCCFDVMHHVLDPMRMAQEMLRVTRKHFFLSEANGASLVRRVGELFPSARALRERSYLPRTYRKFFQSPFLSTLELHPFYFFVIPKIFAPLIPLNVFISEVGECIPFLRWQGQRVLIYGVKKQAEPSS